MTDQQKDQPSLLFVILIVIAAIASHDIAKQHISGNAAVGIGGCAIGLIASARVRWDLKGRWWFWVALCIGAMLQIPLILLMPWSDRYISGIGAMTFVIPGFVMALGCVFLAEKIFAGSD